MDLGRFFRGPCTFQGPSTEQCHGVDSMSAKSILTEDEIIHTDYYAKYNLCLKSVSEIAKLHIVKQRPLNHKQK